MEELAAAEVYSPRTIQVWTNLLNWLSFVLQIFAQILHGVPSFAQVLSYVGLRHGSFLSSPSSRFKPMAVIELSDFDDAPIPNAANVYEGIEDAPPLKKLTVVLDLDETLVSAYETSNLPATLCAQATKAGLEWFELECIFSDRVFDGKPKINHMTVFERPGVRDFLNQLSEFADLVLFTAALEGYAKPVVDRIDVGNQITHRLYRQSTSSTGYREHVKDLSRISEDLCRIVIVDNNPFSFLMQPLNGIPCIPFSAEHPKDKQLLEVILPLLKDLSLEKDVRPMLYEKFHMPEWFQKNGIPASRRIKEDKIVCSVHELILQV